MKISNMQSEKHLKKTMGTCIAALSCASVLALATVGATVQIANASTLDYTPTATKAASIVANEAFSNDTCTTIPYCGDKSHAKSYAKKVASLIHSTPSITAEAIPGTYLSNYCNMNGDVSNPAFKVSKGKDSQHWNVKFERSYKTSKADLKKLDGAVSDIVENDIEDGDFDVSKDFRYLAAMYHYVAFEIADKSAHSEPTAFNALAGKNMSATAKSRLFYALSTASGNIDVTVVNGTDRNGNAISWNLANVGGNWYSVDFSNLNRKTPWKGFLNNGSCAPDNATMTTRLPDDIRNNLGKRAYQKPVRLVYNAGIAHEKWSADAFDWTRQWGYPGDRIKLSAPYSSSDSFDGFVFNGWYSDKKFKNAADRRIVLGNKGTTVYAKWTAVSFKISYKLNGGKNSKKNPKTRSYGKTVKLAKPKRSGYKFKGWYADKKMTKKVTKIGKYEKKTTVYAKWKKKK